MNWIWPLTAMIAATISGVIMIRKTDNMSHFSWEPILGIAGYASGFVVGLVGLFKPACIYWSVGLFAMTTVVMAIPPIRSWRRRHDGKRYVRPEVRAYRPDIRPFPGTERVQD